MSSGIYILLFFVKHLHLLLVSLVYVSYIPLFCNPVRHLGISSDGIQKKHNFYFHELSVNITMSNWGSEEMKEFQTLQSDEISRDLTSTYIVQTEQLSFLSFFLCCFDLLAHNVSHASCDISQRWHWVALLFLQRRLTWVCGFIFFGPECKSHWGETEGTHLPKCYWMAVWKGLSFNPSIKHLLHVTEPIDLFIFLRRKFIVVCKELNEKSLEVWIRASLVLMWSIWRREPWIAGRRSLKTEISSTLKNSVVLSVWPKHTWTMTFWLEDNQLMQETKLIPWGSHTFSCHGRPYLVCQS